ncbi:hypothetical protein PRIPAC_78665 [Pristionchus pacificus]|uniref:Uncharacterized protein n=1 Tax=Pristionchus pacificus TaxID=54126 RepID=A0A2A6C246_PRIPA|nr:hypothetical protein PRIPAC_78665 [Pristionchus pacificus]|eukprot:PDM72179.1 hypothetical protein PRIPAC_38613 [Pristionchus pacificus]
MAAPSHPWSCHLNVRGRFRQSAIIDQPDCHPPPLKFANKAAIAPPNEGKARTHRERVTLADVVAFRTRHILGAPPPRPPPAVPSSSSDDDFEVIDAVAEGLGGLSLEQRTPVTPSTERPVLYRSTGATKEKGEWTVLEASHFEVFLPDRKDLRFIVVETKKMVEAQCVEGHLFAVFGLQALKKKLPALMLQAEYPIVWSAARADRIDSAAGTPFTDIIYVAKVMDSGDARAVCNWSQSFITVHSKRFSDECQDENQQLAVNALYEADMLDTSSAWIYPVEPPKNRVEYAKLTANVRSTSNNTGVFAEKIRPLPEKLQEDVNRRMQLKIVPEGLMLNLFKLGIRFRELTRPKETVNVIVRSIDPPELIVLSEVYFVAYVSILLVKKGEGELPVGKASKLFLTVNSISHPTRGNNKHTVLKCSYNSRMLEEFPDFAAMKSAKTLPQRSAVLEGTTNDNITFQSLEMIEEGIEEMMKPIGRRPMSIQMNLNPPALFQYLYGKVEKMPLPSFYSPSIGKRDNSIFHPNQQQGEAISMYHGMNTPAFCILSPPGSGKTTVATAMAASLVKNRAVFKPGEVQLLLAVQNVAVENLANSLQSFDTSENRLRAYYIKSLPRVDAESKAPYDIKALLPNYTSYMENAQDNDIIIMQKYFEVDNVLRAAKTDPSKKISGRQKYKLTLECQKMLRKAKATLEKYLQPQILLSTVDLALCYLQGKNERGIRRLLKAVTRVVIDESSLLTESTFYSLVRLFPNAKFILIGDDMQLPPFMYDEKVTGHMLTARSALSVALANKNIPSIKLLEVYRAPPRLVDAYNELSYEGQLVSRKREDFFPLSEAGLVERGRPQLLLVANPGSHSPSSSKSLWNASEIEVLISLLKMFPEDRKDQIMIICLYKEQKKMLERKLGTNYELHTVDSAQGKEKPIVFVLTTRSDDRTPFFASKERCTVAVSRQQQALIIIGNSNLLSGNAPTLWPWSTVLSSAQFTTITADSLAPVDEDVKRKLQEIAVDDEADVTDVPVAKQTYAIKMEDLEEHAAAQQKMKDKRKKKK